MGKEIIFMVEEDEIEGGFTAQALGCCIVTEAGTLEELKTMIQDAVRCNFDESDMPSIIRLHIVKDEVIPA
ncbi:2-oxoisovalerate dehydrogenase [Chloroflexota bacterium]